MNSLTFVAVAGDNRLRVHPWLQAVIALCLVALTVALIPVFVTLRRIGERAERVLAVVESDLRPTIERVQGLVDELSGLSQDVRAEVERVSVLTRRVSDLSDGIGHLVSGLAGLARVGRLVGVAAGLKTGLDVFLNRLHRHHGDSHE